MTGYLVMGPFEAWMAFRGVPPGKLSAVPEPAELAERQRVVREHRVALEKVRREQERAARNQAAAREKARLERQRAARERAAAREKARREQREAVCRFLSGASIAETAAVFGVTSQSIRNWLAQYRLEQAQERARNALFQGPVCAAWVPGSLCGVCNHDSCWEAS